MKNRGKVGNKPGQPKYRTTAEFRVRKNQQVNSFKKRPTKVFNRGK